MGPAKYSQLRQLERTRLSLLRAGDTTASEDEETQRHGFADLRHFVAAYRDVFGDQPRIGPFAG